MIPRQAFWYEWRIEKGQILTGFKLDIAFFIPFFTPPPSMPGIQDEREPSQRRRRQPDGDISSEWASPRFVMVSLARRYEFEKYL
jgi:hypothetical protein